MGTYRRCSPQRGPRRAGSWREERTSYAAAHTRGQCAPAKHASDTRSSPAPHPRIPLADTRHADGPAAPYNFKRHTPQLLQPRAAGRAQHAPIDPAVPRIAPFDENSTGSHRDL